MYRSSLDPLYRVLCDTAGTNFVLVATLPLLPSGMLILHAGGVLAPRCR